MRVRVHPADNMGCGYFRMELPARASGLEVELISELPVTRWLGRDGQVKKVEPQEIDADVLVFQRVAEPEVLGLLPMLQRRGHAVVIDVDDDFSCLHPQHPARFKGIDWRVVMKACAKADLVTATTPALLRRYAPHGRGVVLPNCVPENVLEMPREPNRELVGWTGVAQTHPGDLEATGGAVGDVLEATNTRFLHIGPPREVRERLRLPESRFESLGPVTPIPAYHERLGVLGAGIVPLGDSKFNEAKSHLKGLEMASRGVPFVASPTAEYRKLAQKGVGVLADWRARKWRRALTEVITDDALRQELIERGLEVVRESYTYEKQGYQWAEAWEEALAHRKASSRTAVAA